MQFFSGTISVICFLTAFFQTSHAQNEKSLKKAENLYFNQKDTIGALILLTDIIASDSNNNEAILLHMFIQQDRGELFDALYDQKILCRRFSERNFHWNNLTNLYVQLGYGDYALNAALKARSLMQTGFTDLMWVAASYAVKGNEPKAIFWYLYTLDYITQKDELNQALKNLDLVYSLGYLSFRTTKDLKLHFNKTYDQREHLAGDKDLDSIKYFFKEGFKEDHWFIINYMRDYLKHSITVKNPRYFVQRDFLRNIGRYEYEYGNDLKAFELYFTKSYDLSYDLGDTLECVEQMVEMGEKLIANQPQLAKKYFLLNLSHSELKPAIRDSMYARIYSNLSELHVNKIEPDSGIYYARKVIHNSRFNQYPNYYSKASNVLSLSFAYLKRADSAIFYNKLAYSSYGFNHQAQIKQDEQLVRILHLNSLYDKSLEYSTLFIRIYDSYEKEKKLDLSGLYQNSGLCYLNLGDTQNAELYFKLSLEKYKAWLDDTNERGIKSTPPERLYHSYNGLKYIYLNKPNSLESLFALSEDNKSNAIYLSFTGKNYSTNSLNSNTLSDQLKTGDIAFSFNLSEKPRASYILATTNKGTYFKRFDLGTSLEELFKQYELKEWSDSIEQLTPWFQKIKKYDVSRMDEIRTSLYIGVAIYGFKSMFDPNEASRGVKAINAQIRKADLKELRNKTGRVLYDLLFKPFEELLKDKTRLLIATDGVTGILPFEALINKQDSFLGQRFELVYVPSFTLSNFIKEKKKTNSKQMIICGNPDYNGFIPGENGQGFDLKETGFGNWSDLPATEKEISAIRGFSSETKVLSGKTLSETIFKNESQKGTLLKYNILHFAVHGMFSNSDYTKNALVLTEPTEGKEDGFLQFNEITKLKLNSDMVCLSACQTAEAEFSRDVSPNLVSAFLMAGSSSVIGTSWKIDDQGTALFMKEYYSLLNENPGKYSECLYRTRINFLGGKFGEKYKDPYYWAAFRYTGLW